MRGCLRLRPLTADSAPAAAAGASDDGESTGKRDTIGRCAYYSFPAPNAANVMNAVAAANVGIQAGRASRLVPIMRADDGTYVVVLQR